MSLDDLREEIEAAMEEGFEITAEDFEGRECAHCGEMIPFIEWPENVVTWDIRVQEPGEPKEPYFARYYYCSEDCKRQAKRSGQDVEAGDPDIIHEDEIDDETLIADGGTQNSPTDSIVEGGVTWNHPAPHSSECTCSWCEEVTER